MKTNIKHILLALACAAAFQACVREPSTDLGKVTDVQWEPVSGGAVITYTAPVNNNLQYVKASYVNSAGKSVFNVCSIYDCRIEVSGLLDENRQYPVELVCIDKNGAESPVETVMVTPSRAYINIVKDNIEFSPIMGGISVTWHNPSGALTGGKPVHVAVTYDSELGPETRYISSSQEDVFINIRNISPGHHSFTYSIEDQSGNKADVGTGFEFEIMEEVTIPKYTEDEDGYKTFIWELVPELTTLKEVYENSNAAVFDGVIDTAASGTDNSYAGTNADASGGQLKWDTDQMDIVIDMHQVVNISRIRAWQRAYWYGWDDIKCVWLTSGISQTEYYYEPENIRSFKLFGSMDMSDWFLIEHCDIAVNTTEGPLPVNKVYSDSDYPDRNGGYDFTGPDEESLQIGREGHLWELQKLSPDCRYIRIRITSNWDLSKRTASGLSEIELYGGIVSDNL